MGNIPQLGQFSTAPIFNTKAVARETDVPADTFRAWERRYGIPQPERTAGGHRLYSEQDIAIIRWLRDRTAEGMNISHAVMLLRNSLENVLSEPSALSASSLPIEPRAMQRLSDDLVTALISFDQTQADRVLSEAFTLYPFEEVLLHVVQPTMVDIGEQWHRHEINIAAEHFATQYVRRKLSALLSTFEGDATRAMIVVACAPNELHDLGTLLVALFLVRRGWHVVYLGPQVPLSDLVESVHRLEPDLVCLSASITETATQLRDVANALLETFPQIHVGYGGRIFNLVPEIRSAMPGVFLGEDARTVVSNVAALFARD